VGILYFSAPNLNIRAGMKIRSLSSGYTLEPISRDHTGYLKGIAILMIVFHNYYKWVFPITGENEFWFSADSIGKCLVALRTDPREIFNVFFNFLGFYGVQVFMVISAYGLARSWQKGRPGYGRFILHRFDKLYPSLFLAALVFILITIIRESSVPGPDLMKDLLYQLALFPGKPTGISGPWWFYSFIFQFYLVFPAMMWVWGKAGLKGLAGMVIAGYLVTILFYTPMRAAGFNPYTLFIGHMPEFCLGIWLAGRERLKVPYPVLAFALALLVCGNIYEWLWPFANLSAALLLMTMIQYLWSKREKMKFLTSLVSFSGAVSMYLFASHGLFRNGFINMANFLGSPWASMLTGLAFLLFSLGISWLMMHTESSFRTWVGSATVSWKRYLRFFGVIVPVIGTVILFFVLDQSTREQIRKGGAVVFSRTDDFETVAPKFRHFAVTSYYHSGRQALVLPPPDSWTPTIDADPGEAAAGGLYEAEVSAWLFASDTGAQAHVVLEVIDIAADKILEWKSSFIAKDKFPRATWFQGDFLFPVPPEYRRAGFRFRALVWAKDASCPVYVDDLKLELRSRR
jgi:peptidoglycan/LPS O-acetylase OafA/YrhL